MQLLATLILKILGWKLRYTDPGAHRYVLIVAPHTSNWDFPLGILAGWGFGLRPRWIGKHTLFRGPAGPLFRALGGIPVHRGEGHNLSGQMASRFANAERLVLAMAPEGTRGATDHWKSGFWHIAREAEVPIVMVYLDYEEKEVGLGGVFQPGEVMDADLEKIRNYYRGKRGKYPEKESVIAERRGSPAG